MFPSHVEWGLGLCGLGIRGSTLKNVRVLTVVADFLEVVTEQIQWPPLLETLHLGGVFSCPIDEWEWQDSLIKRVTSG